MNTLVDRVKNGMTTERDARVLLRIIDRCAAYEIALRRISVHGTGDVAMLATRVLCEPESAYLPSQEVFDGRSNA